MSKLNVVYTSLLICLTFGCASSIRSLSDIKWTGKETSISNKIDNLGYYKIHPKQPEAFIFYDDGTMVLCNRIPEDTTCHESMMYPSGCTFDDTHNQWDDGTTGLYRVEGDTIYANMYFRNGFYFSPRCQIHLYTVMYKMKFLILDKTKIIWLEEHEMDKEFPNPRVMNDTLIFHKAEQLPPPNTVMKKKRWLWK